MQNVLRESVLVLNRSWQAVDVTDVETAFCNMTRGVCTGMDTELMRPVTMNEWMTLLVRDGDKSIGTLHGRVRVPTVIVAVSYAKVPKKRPKLTNRAIAERDGFRCQVTGEYCPTNGSVDHLVPKSRGGAKKSWKNMAWMKAKVNQKKGDRTLEEAGLTLLRQPFEPPEVPATLLIKKRPDRPEWDSFLIH